MLDLTSLGFTKEELADRVVQRIADQILSEQGIDENGESTTVASSLDRRLRKLVAERVDVTINALGEKHVLPNITNYVENLCLQETNKWGEKIGAKLTFVEYLVKRAESYMTEPVNFDGKSKDESSSYGWSGTQTRITHLVHKHLHYSIESAIKAALAGATTTIAKSLHETCRLKINEAAASLTINVKTK